MEEPPAARTPANKIPVISTGSGAALPAPSPLPPAAGQLPHVGLVLAEITPQIATQLKFADGTKGLAILRIEEKSLAAQSGLVRGTAVVKVDDTAVSTVKDFKDALARADKAKGAVLQVLRRAARRSTPF